MDRARQLLAQAKKTEQMWSWWNPDKWEQAGEMYAQAANAFKVAKAWRESGDAFLAASNAFAKSPSSAYEAAQKYVEAAAAYRKCDVQAAAAAYRRGVELFLNMARFTMAAKHQKDLAEMLEAEGLTKEAMDAYQLAADYYESENQSSSQNQCLVKVALFAAQGEDYAKAIEIFEKVAEASVAHHLLRHNAKEHFFRAALCHLALPDVVGTRQALQRYCDIDPNFARDRAYSLLNDLCTAFDASDPEAFTNAVTEYHSISRLDDWKTTILLRIKKSIQSDDGLT